MMIEKNAEIITML